MYLGSDDPDKALAFATLFQQDCDETPVNRLITLYIYIYIDIMGRGMVIIIVIYLYTYGWMVEGEMTVY